MKINLLLSISFTVIAVGCIQISNEKIDIEKMAADSLNTNPLSIEDYTNFEWDVLHIFPPYTPKEEIKNQLGFEVSTSIESFDSITLLVFTDKKGHSYDFEISRSSLDFSESYRENGYKREEAVFTISEGSKNWKKAIGANKTVLATPRESLTFCE